MTNLYDNILILQENGTAAIVGEYDQLLEDNSETNDSHIEQKTKKETVGAISNLMNGFRGKGNEIEKVAKTLDKFPKGGGIAKILSYLGIKVITKGDSLFKAIYGFIGKLWDTLKAIPGVGTIVTSMSTFVNKLLDGKEIGFGDHKVNAKELVKFITTTFVLVGLSGYIIKKAKAKLQGDKQESAAINYAINTEPMILTESVSGKTNSLLKKAPGIIGSLIDFGKNVKDSTVKFMIQTIGVIIAFGIFTVGAIVSKPVICKAIKSYDDAIKEGNKNNNGNNKDQSAISNALSVVKKTGVSVLFHMAKVVTFGIGKAGIDIYLTCDNVDTDASRRAKTFILK